MSYEWSLDALYTSYESEAYVTDFNQLESHLKQLGEMALEDSIDGIKKAVAVVETINILGRKLFAYSSLQNSVNTTDEVSLYHMAKLQKLFSEHAKANTRVSKFFGTIQTDITLDNALSEYQFFFKEEKDRVQHMLSEEVEEVIAKMELSAGRAWNQLRDFLTSTVTYPFNGEDMTMSAIRNLAYDKDASVRKAAYEAEMKMYESIKEPVAFSLNNIKSQVNDISALRGYESALDATLKASRMSKDTLNALIEAIKESLPAFRRYLKHKATLLGHENGLPFYDLFAPIGNGSSRTFTYEESQTFLIDLFSTFSQDLADLAKEHFDNGYIDVFPRKGKVGGAFCNNLPMIKQSRVMLNFDGSLSSVTTTAHELGHSYHGYIIENHRPLNWEYSMPVAETASTFNEAIVMKNVIASSSDDEKASLLESEIQDVTQIIVDIYSRYLFESAVFEARKERFLFSKDLEEMMLNAQKEAYGDGLDENALHPFMWICKPHYYSTGLSFYNFPYAFGGLFSKGLFAMYEEQPVGFVEKYQHMLRTTTIGTVEDTGKAMGIDLTDKSFWSKALKQVEQQIDTFIQLTSNK